jgi:hypothetical protein
VSDSPLNRRGWVLQERLLCPRLLHFADDQLFWECFTENKCEGFPGGFPGCWSIKSLLFFPFRCDSKYRVESTENTLSDEAFHTWCAVVEMYTKCALTRPGDKLVALSGLAHVYLEVTGDEYLSGLWKSQLIDFLTWFAIAPMEKPPSGYIAPSWTWACGTGPVNLTRKTNHFGICD